MTARWLHRRALLLREAADLEDEARRVRLSLLQRAPEDLAPGQAVVAHLVGMDASWLEARAAALRKEAERPRDPTMR